MDDNRKSRSSRIADDVWNLFSGVKTSIVLLVLWLVGSVFGTLIPQNGPPEQVVALYGPQWSDWMFAAGLFDVYHSTWYSVILLMLMFNLVACTVDMLPRKLALALEQPKTRKVTGGGKRFFSYQLLLKDSPEKASDHFRQIIARHFPRLDVFQKDGERHIYAQKQAFSHFMIFLVHLSVLLILLGGFVSAQWGFEGIMEIPEGEERDFVFRKIGNDYQPAGIPFTVRCDDFRLDRFSNGGPKDYYSSLTVMENGQQTAAKRIEVNEPLSYGKFNFYQSSFHEKAALKISVPEKNIQQTVQLGKGEMRFVPETGTALRLSSFSPGSEAIGMMAQVLVIHGEEGKTFQVPVTSNAEQNARMQEKLPVKIDFASKEPAYTTGLMVVADPGVGWIWAGSFLMVLGLYLTFYTSHRRLSIRLDGKRAELRGLAQRNPTAFRREIEAILHEAGFDPETAKNETT